VTQLPSDDQRFRRLFDTHSTGIERYCLRRLGSNSAADAAAEVMLIAWRRIDEVPAGDAAKLWLYGVARNVVLGAQRSQRRRLRLDAKVVSVGTTTAESPETQLVRNAEDRELLEAMSLLRARDREILELRLWDELSRDEVAQLLEISKAGVDKRFQRALQRLRRSLEARQKRRSLRKKREEVGGAE